MCKCVSVCVCVIISEVEELVGVRNKDETFLLFPAAQTVKLLDVGGCGGEYGGRGGEVS